MKVPMVMATQWRVIRRVDSVNLKEAVECKTNWKESNEAMDR